MSPGMPGGVNGQALGSLAVAHLPARTLGDLVSDSPDAEIRGDGGVPISSLGYRSDEVTPGCLFFCVPGTVGDGHAYAAVAVARGATALMVERWLDLPVPQVLVPSVRGAMGEVSATFFGRPADSMTLVGITGTNGKTTTTYLLEAVFRAAGWTPGVVGTTGVRFDGRPTPFPRTTPEAPDLHRLLAQMRAEGIEAVAMEVSSHGLDQRRVDGVRFARAVFTNLSQDHLDYHVSMERYLEAKARLFTSEMSERAIVNVDDPAGRRLVGSQIPTVTYGLSELADVRATEIETTDRGITFVSDGVRVRSPLRGGFNVENCLATFATARDLGIANEVTVEAIATVDRVPGRVETVDEGQGFLVLVDYAHTPASVENVLRTARSLTSGRLIVVLGCGGDRDRAKRAPMGRAATSNADLTVLTSDNPRSEDPNAILAEIIPGAEAGGGRYTVEPDRRSAIRLAIGEAEPGDIVVIAGKGHETYQELADRTIAFDDRLVAQEELRSLGRAP